MRLELVNFRCWKNKIFEFPDEGLVLLSGSSGSGKTSILSSIYFVLYGTGTKVISFGEKKCSVRLVYRGLDITRTKGPNLLVLSLLSGSKISEYEDDVAQEIIIKKFGTNFTLTSYITQKTVQSFLNLGPNDKMNFLEQLSLGDEDISGIKKKTKEKIKEKKDSLNQKVGQLELLTTEIEEMKTPMEIPFPLGNKHSDIKIKNESIFWKRTVKALNDKRELLQQVEKDYSKEKVNKAIKEGKQTTLNDLQLKEIEKRKEIDDIEFDGDETIIDLKTTLSFLKNKREFSSISDRYNEERTRYEELYNQEISLLQKEEFILKGKVDSFDIDKFSDKILKKIEDDILTHESIVSLSNEITQNEKTRTQYKEYNREEKINELEEKICVLQKEITITERRVDIKCCPNCKVSLRFSTLSNSNNSNYNKTTLVLADGEPVDEEKSRSDIKRIKCEISEYKTLIDNIKKEVVLISCIETKIREYKNKLESKKIPCNTLEYLKREIKTLKEMRKEWTDLSSSLKTLSSKIKSNDLSPTLNKLKLQVDKRKKELQSIKKQLEEELNDFDTDYTEEELREEISRQELLSQKKKSLDKQISELKQSINKLQGEIEKIELLSDTRDFEDEIHTLSNTIKELIVKDREHKNLDIEIKKYLQYMKDVEEYKKWTDKLQKCKDDEDFAKKELSYCDIFLRKIQEAESLSVSQTIDNINIQMNYYLEKFFPTNPITVLISPYKETKKDIKSSINITVGYKGVDTDLMSLSGGEYDRVTLSLMLTLNIMFGSDLIMLDESISSLDSELTGEIIEVLKENMKEKVIIIVSHQIPTGLFDGVVNVEE